MEGTPTSPYYVGIGPGRGKEIELVVQVANHFYPTGGILSPLNFGTYQQIMKYRDQQRALDALMVFGYLVLGFYFLGTFFQKRIVKYILYFSLFCLLQGVHLATLKERLLDLVIPDLPVAFLAKIQIPICYMMVCCFLLFVYDFLKKYANKKTVYFLNGTVILIGFPLLFDPGNILAGAGLSFYAVQIGIVLVIAMSIIYSFWILCKALYKGMEASEYVLIIVTSIFCYALLMALDFLFEMDRGKGIIWRRRFIPGPCMSSKN